MLRGSAVAAAFLTAYVLAVGALTHLTVVTLGLVERRYAGAPWQAWLSVHWPRQAGFYAPAAVAALLAAWYSRLPMEDVPGLLGAFLGVILFMMLWDYASWELAKPSTLLFQLLLGGAFFVAARICRRRVSAR
jgi:hypothetical protein